MNISDVRTTTAKSSETWVEQMNIRNLPPCLAEQMRFLASLCDKEERMMADERYELIDGTAHNIAVLVCNSVADWSEPRPRIPAAVACAWHLAKKMVISAFDEEGQTEWNRIEDELRTLLIAGFYIS